MCVCVCVCVCVPARACCMFVAFVIGMLNQWDHLYRDCNNILNDVTSASWPSYLGD